MGNSQLLKNVLRKRAAAAGAAPFTPNLAGEGFNTVKTPGPSPADAPAPTPMNQVKNFSANALNQGKNMFGAAENEVAQAKPMVEAAGAAVKPYFNGLGSNPGQWAAGHPIGTMAAGAGAAYLLYKLLHKKQQPQVDGQPKMAGDALDGARANVGAGITDINSMASEHAHAHPAGMPAPKPVPVQPAPAPGVVDQLTGAAKTLGTQAQGFNAEHPAAKYIAGGAAALGSAALLAHLLNKPSKKDQAGHIAPAAPAVA